MTEKEKMLSGQIYSAVDKQLLEELYATKEVVQRYNSLSQLDDAGRLELLKGLLAQNCNCAGEIEIKYVPVYFHTR